MFLLIVQKVIINAKQKMFVKIFQDYDCYYGSRGSYYPEGTPGGSTFNVSTLDIINNYGNICSGDSSYMNK